MRAFVLLCVAGMISLSAAGQGLAEESALSRADESARSFADDYAGSFADESAESFADKAARSFVDDYAESFADKAARSFVDDYVGSFEDEMMPRARIAAPNRLASPRTEWDATRIYPQLVVLFKFSDSVFSMPNPQAFYDSVLNVLGFNKGVGPGCAAEYMLAQSDGLFHVRFDVFGPFRIDFEARQAMDQKNMGELQKAYALSALFATYPDMDYSIYDWDGNGIIEQVLYVCAGPSADKGNAGFVWPNTSAAPSYMETPDHLPISWHCISPEGVYANKYYSAPYGFGTLMHEYSHAFGLPDVYPMAGDNETNIFSVADSWDLMDGGNCINNGWCPPNYTAFERMNLHWLTPVELGSDTTITGMLPVAEGGEAYLIRHTENEFLLLENRQQTGWDYGVPGRGLTIWHIDYDAKKWRANSVNNDANLRMSLYNADNLTYKDWRKRVKSTKAYANLLELIRCAWLSTTPYPWLTDTTDWVNDQLTETSTPALVMYHENGQGSKKLGKRITNIQMADDGSISFHLEVDGDEQRIDNQSVENINQKLMKDGVLYIHRDGKIYTITGMEVTMQ